MEDYGFNLDPDRQPLREKMTFREGMKYFFEGFWEFDWYESRVAIVFVMLTLTPFVLLIAALVKWLFP